MPYFGEYLQKIDSQHRVVIPNKLRDQIGEAELRKGIKLARGLDKCLFFLPGDEWERMAAKYSSGQFVVSNARMVQRLFFGATVELVPDKLWRIVLPERLRALASLEGEVLFAGVSDRIEVWNPGRWSELTEEHEADYERLTEEMYRQPRGGDSG